VLKKGGRFERIFLRCSKNFKGGFVISYMVKTEKKKKGEVEKKKIKSSSSVAYKRVMAALTRLRMRN